MHVVALVHAYLPHHLAGSERMMQELLATLVRRGHTATVLTTTQQLEDYTFEGVEVRAHSDATQAAIKPDLLISHHNESSRTGRWARVARIPLVYVLNDDFASNLRAVHSFRPNLLVVNSRWLYRSVASGSVPKLIVHPRVDPARHHTKRGTKVTLVNLSENKGADTFYAIADRMPNVNFLGIEGVYGRQVIHHMPNVEIRKPHHDPRTIWADTRILLMPSKYESYGMVAIEAGASGIPTIAHPTLGLLESLSYAGTFVDRADIEGWVGALVNLLGPANRQASSLAQARTAELDTMAELETWADHAERLHHKNS